jgi:hypothetical protein
MGMGNPSLARPNMIQHGNARSQVVEVATHWAEDVGEYEVQTSRNAVEWTTVAHGAGPWRAWGLDLNWKQLWPF